MEEKYLRIAAYCCVSIDQKEQDSSIELQELRYRQMIEENPDWENAGIFSERATGLNLQERSAFQTMIRRCRKEKIKLILTKLSAALAAISDGASSGASKAAYLAMLTLHVSDTNEAMMAG